MKKLLMIICILALFGCADWGDTRKSFQEVKRRNDYHEVWIEWNQGDIQTLEHKIEKLENRIEALENEKK